MTNIPTPTVVLTAHREETDHGPRTRSEMVRHPSENQNPNEQQLNDISVGDGLPVTITSGLEKSKNTRFAAEADIGRRRSG
ncbi:hypothetical protein L6452_32217 [Arctium lappa]|uniref:Uncharacterized protein n=1 Tax=Arctium lappa TaxID=4217 RepID=A0ACB8Z3P9_ARCLA|nr:hypothetical protein L6452_32217 [Arctium lappa]